MRIRLLILLLLPFVLFAQKNVTTVGVMIKPIIPSNVFRAGDISIDSDLPSLKLTMRQKVGYSFGMVIRMGLTDNWTIETGLNYTKRNFFLHVEDTDSVFSDSLSVGIVGYEMPILALLNVRLADKIYMNAAFGGSIDLYPSNVGVFEDRYFLGAVRNNWLQFALIANIGWEYRTKKDGIFYIGGSYHRPFFPIYGTLVEYRGVGGTDGTRSSISGNYLTLDFRYFFHEDPEKRTTIRGRRKKKVKSQKE